MYIQNIKSCLDTYNSLIKPSLLYS